MLLSAVAALALFAAPETTQSGEPAAQAQAAAKPATKKVCETYQVSGSNLMRKKCHDVPVKADEAKSTEEAKADQPKAQ